MKLTNSNALAYSEQQQRYIGANQNHYDAYYMRYGGCAPVAAANIWAYFHTQGLISLSELQAGISRQTLTALAVALYQYVKPVNLTRRTTPKRRRSAKRAPLSLSLPPSLGVATVLQFNRGMQRFAKSRHIAVSACRLKERWLDRKTLAQWLRFINWHLQRNQPIALVNWLRPVAMTVYAPLTGDGIKKQLHMHWVMIEALSVIDGEYRLEVLTWGGRATLSLQALYLADRALAGMNSHLIAYQVNKDVTN